MSRYVVEVRRVHRLLLSAPEVENVQWVQEGDAYTDLDEAKKACVVARDHHDRTCRVRRPEEIEFMVACVPVDGGGK